MFIVLVVVALLLGIWLSDPRWIYTAVVLAMSAVIFDIGRRS